MNTPRLTYFDIRGRVEATRLLLNSQGKSFNDERILSSESWQKLKPTLPYRYLPRYEDNKVTLFQSQTILRYLARHFELYPETPELQAEADELQDLISEAQEDLWRFAWQDNFLTNPHAYTTTVLLFYLNALQSAFNRNQGPYWLADFTHIDCLAFTFLDEVDAFFPESLTGFDVLRQFLRTMARQPGIEEYLMSKERPMVFGMGRHGPKVDPRLEIPSGTLFSNPWGDDIPLSDS